MGARSRRRGETETPERTTFQKLEQRSIVTDLSVFDTDYIPGHILVRREFDPIVRFFFDALKSSLQQTMVVVGPSGSGKTLASRYYAAEARRYAEANEIPFTSVYLNCRELVSPYVFWQQLLAQLGVPAPKGLSVTDLVARLADTLDSRRHVMIILDEFDKLFTNLGPERANDALYSLARLRANRDLDTAVSSILVSNNAHLPGMFDGPIRSSLNATNLAIGPYGAPELVGILTDRARAGLKKKVWQKGVINYAAAKTAQHSSDARFAIRLLRNAAEEAQQGGGKRLLQDHVDAAFDKTRREMEVEVLERLPTNQLLVLLSLARKAQSEGNRIVRLHQAYRETYQGVCTAHDRKPVVYSHFLHTVSALQAHDLVSNIVERSRRGGYVRLVEINFSPEDVCRVAQAKLSA